MNNFGGKRYYSFGQFLKNRFGFKVYKLPVDAGFTCPNRDGKLGYGGCTYCYNPSFSPPLLRGKVSIYDQIQYWKKFSRKGKKFLAYFQPYTNTYADVETLRKCYDEALRDKDIIGLCIGTRPDCVPNEVLDLIESYTKNYHIWIEYGLQSVHDRTLLRINRCHNFAQFEDAIRRTQNRNISICVHIIFGLPGETKDDMLETVKVLAKMPIDGIKFHHLQVIKGTKLAEEFKRGQFRALSLSEYVSLVSDAIELLPPHITIHRLIGEVLQGDELIAPKWGLKKHEFISLIDQELVKRDSFQGSRFNAKQNKPT